MNMAHQLGMEVLLEMHNERDFEYAELEPDMYLSLIHIFGIEMHYVWLSI